jgi:RecJ-like exonuclease
MPLVCSACEGSGKVTQYPRDDRDVCRVCLGSGCVLCSACVGARARNPLPAHGVAHDDTPLCPDHMEGYYA